MAYNGIKNINAKAIKLNNVIKNKSRHILSSIVVCLLTFACYNISLLDFLGISDFVKRVTLNWTPKTDDIGKIKFVNFSFNNQNNGDGIFIVSSPFKNYFAENVDDVTLKVNGLGDIVVLSPISGVVQNIEYKNGKCNLSITSGDVVVVLENIDYPCVSVGDKLDIQSKVAVSLTSEILFSILCDGKPVNLPASGVNDTFFE